MYQSAGSDYLPLTVVMLCLQELIREWRRYALAVSEAAARWALYFGPHLAGLDPLGVIGFQWMVGLGADIVRAPAEGSLVSPLAKLVRPPVPYQTGAPPQW